MFFEVEIESHIRVPPDLFNIKTEDAILARLNKQFEGYISKDLGFVVAVAGIINIGEGVIIHGDGAAYYETTFRLYTFKPELQEIILGKISDITDFGAFIDIGAIDGMVHIGQTMDDFVSFSKSKVLTGKESKKTLRINDKCRARIIAISHKDPANPKIGLTMRQVMLGNLQWIEQDLKKMGKEKKK